MLRFFFQAPKVAPIAIGDCNLHAADGNQNRALLFLHGLTGTPKEQSTFLQPFADAGWNVFAPMLPGHATHPDDLTFVRRDDWRAVARAKLEELHATYSVVAVAGLSMGGVLAVDAVAHASKPPAALILLATPAWIKDKLGQIALPWLHLTPLKYALIKLKTDGSDVALPQEKRRRVNYQYTPVSTLTQVHHLIREAVAVAKNITCPTLIIHSRRDETAPYGSVEAYRQRIKGSVQHYEPKMSQHVLTRDVEADEIAAHCVAYLQQVTADLG